MFVLTSYKCLVPPISSALDVLWPRQRGWVRMTTQAYRQEVNASKAIRGNSFKHFVRPIFAPDASAGAGKKSPIGGLNFLVIDKAFPPPVQPSPENIN